MFPSVACGFPTNSINMHIPSLKLTHAITCTFTQGNLSLLNNPICGRPAVFTCY